MFKLLTVLCNDVHTESGHNRKTNERGANTGLLNAVENDRLGPVFRLFLDEVRASKKQINSTLGVRNI